MGDQPIAIIGAACRLPGAPDLDAFAELLAAGRDAVTEIPDTRWNKAAFFHPARDQRGKSYTFAAGVLGAVDGFDAGVLRHLPAGGRADGPAAAPAAGAGAGGAGGRGPGHGQAGGRGGRRLCRRLRLGLHDAARGRPLGDGRLLHDRGDALFARPTGSPMRSTCAGRVHGGHRLLLLAGRAAPGLRGAAGGAGAAGAGGRREPAAVAAELRGLLRRLHAVPARALPRLRRARRRLRARGGRGDAWCSSRCGRRWRTADPVHAVVRGTGVNSDGRTNGFSLPNRAGAGGAAAGGLWPLRHRPGGPGLRRGARHRHRRRRPDRGRGARRGAGRDAGRSRCPSGRSRPTSATWRPPAAWPGC